jgi:hypothetical protein
MLKEHQVTLYLCLTAAAAAGAAAVLVDFE